MNNIFSDLPQSLEQEVFEEIVNSGPVRIERIISHGHSSPETGWYQQDENEWVIVLSGTGTLRLDNGEDIELGPGDYHLIPAQQAHKVIRTAADEPTIWLAVFF